jgi:hypothetical protein
MPGRAIAQAVSHWLPTAAARVRARVWSGEICGGQSGVGAGFLRLLRFPLPKPFIPPTSPSSQSPGAVSRCLATSWSPVQGVLLTVLDLVNEIKRKVSWRRPRPKIGGRAKKKKKIPGILFMTAALQAQDNMRLYVGIRCQPFHTTMK